MLLIEPQDSEAQLPDPLVLVNQIHHIESLSQQRMYTIVMNLAIAEHCRGSQG
jgi:hypothetical protein